MVNAGYLSLYLSLHYCTTAEYFNGKCSKMNGKSRVFAHYSEAQYWPPLQSRSLARLEGRLYDMQEDYCLALRAEVAGSSKRDERAYYQIR